MGGAERIFQLGIGMCNGQRYYRFTRVQIPWENNDTAIHFCKWTRRVNQANSRRPQPNLSWPPALAVFFCFYLFGFLFFKIRICLFQGWRPRRSILFCSWGGSEQGFTGVTEWVEEHLALLGSRAIAYLNVDIAVVRHFWLKLLTLSPSDKMGSTISSDFFTWRYHLDRKVPTIWLYQRHQSCTRS